MKRMAVLICFFTFSFFASNAAYASPKVILNNQILNFDVPPTIENGRTLVPLRNIFESLGASVQWDDQANTVIAKKNEVEIKLIIGGNAYKNGKEILLEVPAKIIDGRTMVPLRFVAEALECSVVWNEKTESIIIDAKQEPAWNPKLFESKKYGFRMNYPTHWLASEKPETDTIRFFNMSENNGECEERVIIHIEFTEESVDEILTANAMKEFLLYTLKEDGVNLLNSETTTLNGIGAAKVFYLQKEDNLDVKMLLITAAKDKRIYYVGGGDSVSEFPEFLETFYEMVDTFEFIN